MERSIDRDGEREGGKGEEDEMRCDAMGCNGMSLHSRVAGDERNTEWNDGPRRGPRSPAPYHGSMVECIPNGLG